MKLIALAVFCSLALPSAVFGDNASTDPIRVLELIKNSDHGALTRLLESGLDANARVPVADASEPLLVAACIYGDLRTVSILLKHGARAGDYSLTGMLGESPVAIGMNRGNPDMIDLLIKNGADAAGFTPLMIAMMRGDLRTAKAEIERGADVNAKNKFGRSALDCAHPIAQCVDLLLKHGAKHSYSAADIAIMVGDAPSLRRELQQVDPLRNWSSEVRWAIIYDRPALLDLIVVTVPTFASEEYRSRTPAALAAELGRLECLRTLVHRHADIERLSEGGVTPTNFARQGGKTDCLRFLEAIRKK